MYYRVKGANPEFRYILQHSPYLSVWWEDIQEQDYMLWENQL